MPKSDGTWVGSHGEHYFLGVEGGPAERVTEEMFIRAERAAGFMSEPGAGRVATTGFVEGGVRGTIEHRSPSASGDGPADDGVSVPPGTVALYITAAGRQVTARPAEPYNEAESGYRIPGKKGAPERRYRFHCEGCGYVSFPMSGPVLNGAANGHAEECRRVPLRGAARWPWDD
jgi:hypothetical protein